MAKQEIKQEVCDENKENKKATVHQKIFNNRNNFWRMLQKNRQTDEDETNNNETT